MASSVVVEGVGALEERTGQEDAGTEQEVVKLMSSAGHGLTVDLAEKVVRARSVRRSAGLGDTISDTSTVARLAGLLS